MNETLTSESKNQGNSLAPAKKEKQENGLMNVVINVLIPVFILNKLSSRIGAVYALILALAFPLGNGGYDLFKKKKTNYFSLLGIINVSLTGTLALLHLTGPWFWMKEAVFPSLIGIFVIFSSFSENPFIKTLLLNPQLMDLDLIHQKLEAQGQWSEFAQHLKRSTQLLAMTFFVSATVNFILAQGIFVPIDSNLDESVRATILNEQIGKMTLYAAGVIIVPSMIMLSGILWYLLHGIQKSTGLKTEEILRR